MTPQRYAGQIRCLLIGLAMEKDGKLNGSLGSRHSTTVIQRALWASDGSAGRDDLASELSEQVAELGLERTQAEMRELVDELWTQVQAVRSGCSEEPLAPFWTE